MAKVCPDCEIKSAHVCSSIRRDKTASVPGKKTLPGASSARPSNLFALTVTILSCGNIVLKSAANCSATHNDASTPPIKLK